MNEHECTHSEEKPFKGKVCEKIFYLNGNYIRHEHTCTIGKPFNCIECTYKLYNHIQGYNVNVNFVTKHFLKMEAYFQMMKKWWGLKIIN